MKRIGQVPLSARQVGTGSLRGRAASQWWLGVALWLGFATQGTAQVPIRWDAEPPRLKDGCSASRLNGAPSSVARASVRERLAAYPEQLLRPLVSEVRLVEALACDGLPMAGYYLERAGQPGIVLLSVTAAKNSDVLRECECPYVPSALDHELAHAILYANRDHVPWRRLREALEGVHARDLDQAAAFLLEAMLINAPAPPHVVRAGERRVKVMTASRDHPRTAGRDRLRAWPILELAIRLAEPELFLRLASAGEDASRWDEARRVLAGHRLPPADEHWTRAGQLCRWPGGGQLRSGDIFGVRTDEDRQGWLVVLGAGAKLRLAWTLFEDEGSAFTSEAVVESTHDVDLDAELGSSPDIQYDSPLPGLWRLRAMNGAVLLTTGSTMRGEPTE